MPPKLRNCLNKDKRKGARHWTGSETRELIAKIKQQLKVHDPLSYSKRVKVLNWGEISIPCRSVNECRSRLDVVVKKIHKIRTLAEVLSDVEVDFETADVDKISPVNLPICDEMKRSSPVIEPVEMNNNNLHPTDSLKRKSKRLFNNTPERSDVTPFKLYAKCNYSEDVNEATLKDRYSRQTDSEKLIWIRKTIDSASKDQDVENILTEHERNLLSKEPILGKGKVEISVGGKENNVPNVRKRKFEENDAAIGSMNRKIRIFGESHFDIRSLIIEKMQTPKTIEIAINEEMIEADNGAHEPRLEIKSSVTDSQSSFQNNCSVKSSIQPEQPIKLEKPDLKQESRDPPTPVVRIKKFCNGFLGRIGSWVKRN